MKTEDSNQIQNLLDEILELDHELLTTPQGRQPADENNPRPPTGDDYNELYSLVVRRLTEIVNDK